MQRTKAEMATEAPAIEDQSQFWDEWNTTYRAGAWDDFMRREAEAFLDLVLDLPIPIGRMRILDAGCGTGWLTALLAGLGTADGLDLSEEAIRTAQAQHPQISFQAASLFDAPLPAGAYDLIVAAGVISCVPDHTAFRDRVEELLRPGGCLVLSTPNPYIWSRYSSLKPKKEGQVRNWISRRDLRQLFVEPFEIVRLTTFGPAGDRGLPGVVNSRYVSGVLRRVVGPRRTRQMKERVGLGRELLVAAQYRP